MGGAIFGAAKRAGDAVRRARAFMLEHAYLVTLGAALAVVAASALYTFDLRDASEIGAAAGAPETLATAEPAVAPTFTPQPTATPVQASALPALSSAVRLGGTTVRPVSGGALRAFDRETPVYWPAVSAVKVHAALDLAGEVGGDVLAAMDGQVTAAARDELWGWRVEVAQTDGQTAVYAGLSDCAVQPGANVTRGQALGALLERVPCEAELPAHLHMELLRDGEAQDPATILPK